MWASWGTRPRCKQSLRVTEINYAPLPPNPDFGESDDGTPNAADKFEYIELTNTGSQTLDLAGVTISAGVDFTFPQGTMLGAGQQILVVSDRAALESRYGTGLRIAGQYTGDLADTGDSIFLDDVGKLPIPGQAFSYRAGEDWPARAAGKGSSLQVVDAQGSYDEAANWRASSEVGGSPGTRNALPPQTIVINELLPGGAQPAGDMVELYNVTYRDMDIGGWYLSNSDDDYRRFRIPAGTVIAARGYQVFNQRQLGFALDEARGGQLWLVRPDAQGRPAQFVDFVSFDAAATGISLGPWPELTSPLRTLSEATLGAPNAAMGTGAVVITEVHYNPLDPDGGAHEGGSVGVRRDLQPHRPAGRHQRLAADRPGRSGQFAGLYIPRRYGDLAAADADNRQFRPRQRRHGEHL